MSLKSWLERAVLPDGDVNYPGLSWAKDPNTGIWRSADNEIALVTGGTAHWIVGNTGNLRPNGDNTKDIGSVANSVKDLYVDGRILGNSTFQTYTPALTATVNPTPGTGATFAGWYMTIGKLVTGWARINYGTTGFVAGSGSYVVSLPVQCDATATANLQAFGTWTYQKNSTGANYGGVVRRNTNTTVQMTISSSGSLNATSPAVMDQSDVLTIQFTYIGI